MRSSRFSEATRCPRCGFRWPDFGSLRAKRPAIPALKAILAHHSGDASWRTPRPPLVELPAAQAEALLADLRKLGLEMPGLAA